MLHDRITSNSSIGRRLHQTLKPVCSVCDQPEICRRKLFHSEYPFAKYNIQPTTYTYTQDEYTRFLEGEIVLTRALIFFHCFFFFLQTRSGRKRKRTIYLVWCGILTCGGILSMIDMNIRKLHLALSRYFIPLLPYLSVSPSDI